MKLISKLAKIDGLLEGTSISVIFLSFCWFLLYIFLPYCDASYKEEIQKQIRIELPSLNKAFFQGRHELRQISVGSESSGKIHGNIFLLIGKSKEESVVKFAWKNDKNEFMLTVLPYDKIRIIIDNESEKPYCRFKWIGEKYDPYWYKDWENYILYVVVHLKEDQFKQEVNLKM